MQMYALNTVYIRSFMLLSTIVPYMVCACMGHVSICHQGSGLWKHAVILGLSRSWRLLPASSRRQWRALQNNQSDPLAQGSRFEQHLLLTLALFFDVVRSNESLVIIPRYKCCARSISLETLIWYKFFVLIGFCLLVFRACGKQFN